MRFSSATFLRLLKPLRGFLSQPQKRHIQPERYVQFGLNWLENVVNILKNNKK
jgi:hypothetical protein